MSLQDYSCKLFLLLVITSSVIAMPTLTSLVQHRARHLYHFTLMHGRVLENV